MLCLSVVLQQILLYCGASCSTLFSMQYTSKHPTPIDQISVKFENNEANFEKDVALYIPKHPKQIHENRLKFENNE